MKKTVFENCKVMENDFTECDLTGSTFEGCDFAGSIFIQSNIEKADFRTSNNYSINPENNKISKARFAVPGVTGLLDHYDICIEI
jgi:uncharacterized protein YjbI with pentapeptide repeats